MGKDQIGGVMEAVILAGGKGERLKKISGNIPKPLVKIGNKPVIEHQVDLLRNYDVHKIHIMAGYLGSHLKAHFDKINYSNVEIMIHQEETPLGTSGCIKEIKGELKEEFVVLYGDVMLDMKFDDLLRFHKDKKGIATIVVHPNDHPYDSDLVEVDEDSKVKSFLFKDRKEGYYSNIVNAAVYVLSPAVLKYIPQAGKSDFVKDVFPKVLKDNKAIYAYKTPEYIKDMGTPERWEKVQKDYLSGAISRRSKKNKRVAVFLDRDGTLVEDNHLICREEDLEVFSYVGASIRKLNARGILAIVVTNQPVVARNLCDIDTVKRIHKKMESIIGKECAYFDEILFCPHHPDQGYPEENIRFKKKCACRKPEIGMIEQAQALYNIDLERSYMIGDTSVDIQTGKNAGLRTILLRTGKAGTDNKYNCKPDFCFDNLSDSIDFIISSLEKDMP